MDELCFSTAVELARKIREREISAREVMEAHLAQIARVNPTVNAIVTMIDEADALALADAADAALATGDDVGPLHGLPVAHKDLAATAGMRTTMGSPIYADNIPTEDALIVKRIVDAGALRIGKTNVPEFGAGSQSFNPVFGATLNPYDITKTCGGSSGGAGAALASGMIPIADGSDHGGSLRNPGNFNNVVGFRPSGGRVPRHGAQLAWYGLSVSGPMGRTVEDTALLLSTIAGPDPRDPLSLPESGEMFAGPLDMDLSGLRVAWSPTLGGLPVDRRVSAVLDQAALVFEGLGAKVELADPDLSGVDEAYRTLRAWTFIAGHEEHLKHHRDQLKDTVIWNAEEGLALSGLDVAHAEATRSDVYRRMLAFFEDYDVLLCPVNQVPPFDVNIPYPTEIEGVEMETYIAWMKSAYWISFTGLPAISVPAGFTSDDPALPVGLQIVGPWHQDLKVLQVAHEFEGATNYWKQRPGVVGSR